MRRAQTSDGYGLALHRQHCITVRKMCIGVLDSHRLGRYKLVRRELNRRFRLSSIGNGCRGGIQRGGKLVSVEQLTYLQSRLVSDKDQSNRWVAIHTFGGRGSPLASHFSA